jgi:hypothetical protein
MTAVPPGQETNVGRGRHVSWRGGGKALIRGDRGVSEWMFVSEVGV